MRIRSLLPIAAVAIVIFPCGSRALACDIPNGNDQVADTAALQCLLDQGGTITLNADVQFGYYVDSPLTLRVNGTTLLGTTAFSNRALILAMAALDGPPANGGPILQVDPAVTSYTLSNIWLYGNKFNRPSPVCAGDRGANMWLRGTAPFVGAILLDNIASDQAPCGTSMNVTATNFEIRNSWFDFNGYPGIQGGGGGPFADGLTVFRCDHGYIHDNHFNDNTDVDVVVGGGPGCRVESNIIQHSQNHGWAGIHVGFFDGGNGAHNGSTFIGNTVSSGLNLLSFGIVVGPHPWNASENLTDAGAVQSNSISGGVINLGVEADSLGTVVGNVVGNTPSGHQGNFGLFGCSISADYTVFEPHVGQMSLQFGWVSLSFDNGRCFLR
jgi:hypothetical protein